MPAEPENRLVQDEDRDVAGRRAERGAIAALLALAFAYLMVETIPGCTHTRSVTAQRYHPHTNALRINVNRANWAELVQLPGVGPKLADRILADREAKGPFRGLDDLDRVEGIGPKLLDRISPFLEWTTKEVPDR